MKWIGYAHKGSHKESLLEIDSFLKNNLNLYKSVRIRCLASKKDGLWKNECCVLRAFDSGDRPKPEKSKIYNDFFMGEEWLAPPDLIAYLESFASDKFIVDKQEILTSGKETITALESKSANNNYAKQPGLLALSNQDYIYENSHPIAKWDLPIFPNITFAISDWLEINRLSKWPATNHISKVIIFLPEYRAHITELKVFGKKSLRILLRREKSCPSLKIKGLWRVGESSVHFDKFVTKNIQFIPIPKGELTGLYFYLIDENENIFDFHEEGGPYSSGLDEILGSINSNSNLKKIVLNARFSGENQKLEFKPYIDLNNSKSDQLFESIIAFANAKGGMILMGLSDSGEIDGVEQKIDPNPKRFKKSLATYIVQLRSRISELIHAEPEVNIAPVKIGRNYVLVLEVREGAQKPYKFQKNGKSFIRRGASNVQATAEDISKMAPAKNEVQTTLDALQ